MRFFAKENVVGQICNDLGNYFEAMTDDKSILVLWYFNIDYLRCYDSRRDEPIDVEMISKPPKVENRTAKK